MKSVKAKLCKYTGLHHGGPWRLEFGETFAYWAYCVSSTSSLCFRTTLPIWPICQIWSHCVTIIVLACGQLVEVSFPTWFLQGDCRDKCTQLNSDMQRQFLVPNMVRYRGEKERERVRLDLFNEKSSGSNFFGIFIECLMYPHICNVFISTGSTRLYHGYTFQAQHSHRQAWQVVQNTWRDATGKTSASRRTRIGLSSWAQGWSQKPPWWPEKTALAELKVSQKIGKHKWQDGPACLARCVAVVLLLNVPVNAVFHRGQVVNWLCWKQGAGSHAPPSSHRPAYALKWKQHTKSQIWSPATRRKNTFYAGFLTWKVPQIIQY